MDRSRDAETNDGMLQFLVRSIPFEVKPFTLTHDEQHTMTRITSFNLPKKSFITSAAEDYHAEASPSSNKGEHLATEAKKKSKRRGRRGKSEAELAASDAKAAAIAQRGYIREQGVKEGGGWKRDPNIASMSGSTTALISADALRTSQVCG